MSSSGDEDDFLSADEDVCDEEKRVVSIQQHQQEQSLVELSEKPNNQPESKSQQDYVNKDGLDSLVEVEAKESLTEKLQAPRLKDSSKSMKKELEAKNNQKTVIDDDEEDQEALAERIRERNLRIARKFSAELAKSVKTSAPIPVSVHTSDETRSPECENLSIPGTTKSNLPPAPPPTPALSSSFNSEDQNNTATTSTTQFAWRVPAKSREERSSSIVKSDQAKIALDRLSETLSQADKSLFERVAEDLKKVAIKPSDSSGPQNYEGSITDPALSAISSISDLGNTLGGWGWSGATKLFNSATQVTSQVGSVLDSVVGSGQPTGKPTRSSGEFHPNEESMRVSEQQTNDSRQDGQPSETESSQTGHLKNPIDVIANEPIVDFTLSAMESLGKKAFEVMTERNDTGSLQIKGIGRPWERLTGLTKTSFDEDEPSDRNQVTSSDNGMLRQRSKKSD